MPDVFMAGYSTTPEIIDATEFPIEKPASAEVEAATRSSCKNRNTLKVLIGFSPNGHLTFFLDIFDGGITDKELTQRSGLMSKLEQGDSIMAA